MRIAVIGVGYVGLSNAVLLSRFHEVTAVDVIAEKTDQVNRRISPIRDTEIEYFFKHADLNLRATTDSDEAIRNADIIIICTPTNYDPQKNYFNTSSVEEVLQKVSLNNPEAHVVIKSTIPIGYTRKVKKEYGLKSIVFSPEFLREGYALYDNLHPSRIIVGSVTEEDVFAGEFAQLMSSVSEEDNVPVLVMDSTEAEAVKLFANTYLALRVSYFNELDTYAEMRGLDTRRIIEGICLDPRIGLGYNNPSFGYGGYCLPKDTKQLLANYENVPQNLIYAIVQANKTRKNYIADRVTEYLEHNVQKERKVVGIYRIVMKLNSDNFRNSSILGVMNRLEKRGYEVVIYEPGLQQDEFNGHKVIHAFEEFTTVSDVILANRYNSELDSVRAKVYTRDLFKND